MGMPASRRGRRKGLRKVFERAAKAHTSPKPPPFAPGSYDTASFLDKSRPLPTPEMAQKYVPKPLRMGMSEALEHKYTLAHWASLPQGELAFKRMCNLLRPDGEINGYAANDTAARTMFTDTCVNGALYYCTSEITRVLKQGADVIPDWELTDDMLADTHGMFVWFEEALRVLSNAQGRTEKVRPADRPMDIVGLVVCPIWIGDTDPDKPSDEPRAFVYNTKPQDIRVKKWTKRIHIHALITAPGQRFVIPATLITWDVGNSYLSQRAQYAFEVAPGVPAWEEEDEVTTRMLGTFFHFIKQTILQYGEGRADRGTRKRLAAGVGKFHPNPDPPIRVVQLRRKEYIVPPRDDDKEGVEWSCRWVVSPHWHTYRHGPGRVGTKMVWVEAYIKGPEGKPLRAPSARVFAVTR